MQVYCGPVRAMRLLPVAAAADKVRLAGPSRVPACYLPQLKVDEFPGLREAPENGADVRPQHNRNQEPGSQTDRHPPP